MRNVTGRPGFVLFGAVISQSWSQVPLGMTVLLAAVVLRRAAVSWQAGAFIG